MLLYAAVGISFQAFYIFRTQVQEPVPVDLQGRVMALLITSVGVCRLIVYGVLALAVSGRDPARRSTRSAAARWCCSAASRRSTRSGARCRGLAPRPACHGAAARAAPRRRNRHGLPRNPNRRMQIMATTPALILLGGNRRRLEPALPARRPARAAWRCCSSTRPPPRVDALVHGRSGDRRRSARRTSPRSACSRVRRRRRRSSTAAVTGRSATTSAASAACARNTSTRGGRRGRPARAARPRPARRRVCRNKYLQRRYLAAWSPRSRLVVVRPPREAAGRAGPVPGGRQAGRPLRQLRRAAGR